MVTEEMRQKYKKTIDEFTLMDDTFMSAVFSEQNELCEMLLHIILGNDKIKVIKSIGQYSIKNLQGHSSALDIYCVDENGRHFNVEVQRKDAGAVPQRARYYVGLIDAKHFCAGEEYIKLDDTYVIFITENDVLKGGLPIYHISRFIEESGEPFVDGAKIVYVNGSIRSTATALGSLMHDFFCKNAKDIINKKLADRVRGFKEEEGGRDEMCELMQKIADEAAAEAAAKAAAEAEYKKSVEIAKGFLADGVSVEMVAKNTKLPLEEVKALYAN